MIRISIKQLVTDLNLVWIAGEATCQTEVEVYGINRAGLELSGYQLDYENPPQRRIILFSRKENIYVKNLDDQIVKKRYLQIFKNKPPVIIITNNFQDQRLIQLAIKNNFPLVRANEINTALLMAQILDYSATILRKEIEVHGSLVKIYGTGVLITGPSGIGKSEICLELIKRNHLFVGDDRIITYNHGRKLYGCVHPVLYHLLELRGLGIIDLAKTYGSQSLIDEAEIELIIDLQRLEEGAGFFQRLEPVNELYEIANVHLPRYVLPVSAGRSTTQLIESAVVEFKSNKKGMSGADMLRMRVNEALENK